MKSPLELMKDYRSIVESYDIPPMAMALLNRIKQVSPESFQKYGKDTVLAAIKEKTDVAGQHADVSSETVNRLVTQILNELEIGDNGWA